MTPAVRRESLSGDRSAETEALISVVVPVCNESGTIAEFHRRTSRVLQTLDRLAYEIIYVDDGSSDDSYEQLADLAARDSHVTVVKFSRNFGHQTAITAGLDYARGDGIVIIDADLQDPPEVIVDMTRKWREGYEVVYGQRATREGVTRLKRLTASLFYRVMRRMTRIDLPADVGDFRLVSRLAADQLRTMREKDRFVRGLVSWIGFRQTGVPYDREARFAGDTKYPYRKLIQLALDGMTSLSTMPLKLATWLGSAAVGLGLLYMLSVPVQYLLGSTGAGFSPILAAVLFIGGTQLICIGILGEYIGRMFNEIKARPMYVVEELLGAGPPRRGGGSGGVAPCVSETPAAPHRAR